jgi:hypothetical protein
MARGYRRFSPADGMRSGHGCGPVMRPSRQLALWGYRLVGCGPTWCDGAESAQSSGVGHQAVESRGSGGDFPWSGRGAVAAAIAAGLGRAPSTISREVAGHGGPGRYRGCAGGPAGVGAGEASQGVQVGDPAGVACHRGRAAEAEVSPQQIAGWLKTTYPTTRRCRCRTRRSTAPCSSSPGAHCS